MSHPLLCWDIVMQSMYRKKEFANDIIALQRLMKTNDWHTPFDQSIENSLLWENKVIVITNPALQIVLASKNLYEMTGYRPEEVIGNKPKIFQGPATSTAAREKIRTAIAQQKAFACDIINYRKDGAVYNCHIEGYPVFNRNKQLANFIALENKI